MSLRIEPNELIFPAVIGQTATATLRLVNSSNDMVAFKVKTTAPNNYFVKPKAGVVRGGQSVEVTVTLQQQSSDPSNFMDRFLVQSAVCSSAEGLSKEDWARVPREQIQEKRLAVQFSKSTGSVSGGAYAAPAINRVPSKLPESLSPEDLRAKYEQLVSYAQRVEQEKGAVEEELRVRKAVRPGSSGFSFLQLLVAMIVAAILARVALQHGY